MGGGLKLPKLSRVSDDPSPWNDLALARDGPKTILARMAETLEKRVEDLEKRLAELANGSAVFRRVKNPWRTYGAFREDPEFEEAVRLGREYREQSKARPAS
jgi:hypothetical protein